MKRVMWVLALWAIPTLASIADDTTAPWANKFFVPKEPPAVIVHDFGTVPTGTILTHKFNMTNIYAVGMQVIEPKPSCGCVSILKYTQQLESKESGYIEIQMNARQFSGFKTVTIPVTFIGPKYQSTAVLQVRAFSRTDVMVNPGQIQFGVIPQGQQPSQSVSIQYNGPMDKWALTQVGYNQALMSVSVKQTERVRGRVVYQLTATLNANAPSGAISEQIVLNSNDPNAQALSINASGMVQAALTLVPGNEMKFDGVKVGEFKERRVIVRGTKPFQITKVDGIGDDLTAELDATAAGTAQVVTVKFAPTKEGDLKRTLSIKTSLGDSVTLNVQGSAVKD